MRHPRSAPCWLAVAAGAVAPAVQAEPLTVFDISRAAPERIEALKAAAPGTWTLEMGDRFVVVGDAAKGESSPGSRIEFADAPTLMQFADVEPARLLLRARGCSEHASERGTLLVQGGRWELREVPAHEIESLLAEAGHGWREVPRNATLAARWRAAAKGAAPANPRVQAVVDRFDGARWFADVQALAAWDRSSYGAASLDGARDLIAERFDALGLDVELMPFTMNAAGGGSITRYNVIGTWTGSTQPERWVIVGGHYDSRNQQLASTVNTPGAEDNATGCAGVIELARMLLPSEPSRSIAFMCYAGEEQGLRGSQAHVARLTQQNLLPAVDLVATMDMIGYSGDAQLDVLFESSAAQSALLERFGAAAAAYAPELDVFLSTMPFGSDHVPYLNAALPGMLSIENDWDVYPHYHRTTDTPANIGPNALAMGGGIVKANAAVIADVAGLPFPAFRDGFESP